MIKEIEIENFQNIQKASIELDPGINIFTGESDQGKSAIIKALVWLFFNRPAGEEYIRKIDGKPVSHCLVSAIVNENKIKRERTKTTNVYFLNGKKKEAMGKHVVPEEIQEVLNISETNIQTQFKPFFLLSLSPGQRAKQLNQAVGLDEIDLVLSQINSEVRSTKAKTSELKEKIKEKKNEVKKFNYVDDLKREIKELSVYFKQVGKVSSDITELKNLIQNVEDCEKEIGVLKNTLKIESEVKHLASQVQTIKDFENEISDLKSSIQEIQTTEQKLKAIEKILSAEGDLKQLKSTMEKLQTIGADCTDLNYLLYKAHCAEEGIKKAKSRLQEGEKTLHSIQTRIKKRCPLCGRTG
jgi:exonuclease SbcC